MFSSYEDKPNPDFSARQLQMTALLLLDFDYKTIANVLHITSNTVGTEMKIMHYKFNGHSINKHIHFAFKHGFVLKRKTDQVFYKEVEVKW